MSNLAKRLLTSLLAGAIFFGTYLYVPIIFVFFVLGVFAEILFIEWPRLVNVRSLRGILGTLAYPGIPMASILYLHFMYYDVHKLIPLYPFIVSWAYDAFAYLFGSSIGRHKITPRTSPNKTWEGLFGGFGAVLALNSMLFYRSSGMVTVLITSVIVTLVAFAGDFFESRFKRNARIKDSGSILPGHGGFLDRLDSVFFVAPALVVFLLFTEAVLWLFMHSIYVVAHS